VKLTNVGSLSPYTYRSPGDRPVTDEEAVKLEACHGVAQRFVAGLSKVSDPKELSRALKVGKVEIPTEFDKTVVEPVPFERWIDLERQGAFAEAIWDEIRTLVNRLARDLDGFRSRLVPRTMLALLGALTGLLLVGAVVPMAYLEARGGSSKIYLLLAFAVFSLAVVGVLAYEMLSIRRAAELDRETF
jgi:hypothetical protein